MIRITFIFIAAAYIGCGAPANKPVTVIGEETPTEETTTTIPVISEPIEVGIPHGAVNGNFKGNSSPFYAKIHRVNPGKETTYISFEDKTVPDISVDKTLGGELEVVQLEGFNSDVLLYIAKLKDPNFNKYFLYVLRGNLWKPVVNGFAIHKSNLSESLIPFRVDPLNSNNILRRYSVFDLDSTSSLGYTWRLLEESVPIKNR